MIVKVVTLGFLKEIKVGNENELLRQRFPLGQSPTPRGYLPRVTLPVMYDHELALARALPVEECIACISIQYGTAWVQLQLLDL